MKLVRAAIEMTREGWADSKAETLFALAVVAFFVVLAGWGLSACAVNVYSVAATQEDVTLTVTDKERIQDGDSSQYLVYTEDEVFKTTDSLLLTKFDSSDIYSSLDAGETYDCTVYGFRVRFLSWYRNIVECEVAQ